MKELAEKIGLNDNLYASVLSLCEKKENKINKLAKKCTQHGFSALAHQNDLMKLAVCLTCAKHTKEQYKRLKISDDIFYDTMSDIRIWCENNGNKGLKNYAWIQNHLKTELFRLGRLQFQFYTCNNPLYDYSRLPFNKGEKTIFVHIPQGERLIYSDCVNSLKAAKAFFAEHFPDYDYKFFICESWLLYEDNWRFMKSGCNILQFQSLFDIVMSSTDDRQSIERIFGKRRLIKKNYPENTSLQKSAKKFMLDGGKMGEGLGVINKNEI